MNQFCPLASGSKGNSIYVGTKDTKILIDAGLSAKALQAKLSEINVDLSEIDAILLTHEHSDHIKGLGALVARTRIPIFANSETAKAIYSQLDPGVKFKIFSTGEAFEFGDIQIQPFSIQHDAVDPVAFTFQIGETKIGLCADIGFSTSLVAGHLKHCDYLYIEANHEPSMVHACSRPMVYKQRVLSKQGHLSNEEAGALIQSIYHEGLKHIYLAHLSSECNNPALALEKIQNALKGKEMSISIAFQDKVSRLLSF